MDKAVYRNNPLTILIKRTIFWGRLFVSVLIFTGCKSTVPNMDATLWPSYKTTFENWEFIYKIPNSEAFPLNKDNYKIAETTSRFIFRQNYDYVDGVPVFQLIMGIDNVEKKYIYKPSEEQYAKDLYDSIIQDRKDVEKGSGCRFIGPVPDEDITDFPVFKGKPWIHMVHKKNGITLMENYLFILNERYVLVFNATYYNWSISPQHHQWLNSRKGILYDFVNNLEIREKEK